MPCLASRSLLQIPLTLVPCLPILFGVDIVPSTGLFALTLLPDCEHNVATLTNNDNTKTKILFTAWGGRGILKKQGFLILLRKRGLSRELLSWKTKPSLHHKKKQNIPFRPWGAGVVILKKARSSYFGFYTIFSLVL